MRKYIKQENTHLIILTLFTLNSDQTNAPNNYPGRIETPQWLEIKISSSRTSWHKILKRHLTYTTPASLCMSAHHAETSADLGYMPSLPWAYENNKHYKVKNTLVSATRLQFFKNYEKKNLLSLYCHKIWKSNDKTNPKFYWTFLSICLSVFWSLKKCGKQICSRSKTNNVHTLLAL